MFKPNANFSRISNTPLMVDKVLHKAIIDINEEGTEAAATTGEFNLKKKKKSFVYIFNKIKLFFISRFFKTSTLYIPGGNGIYS